MSESNQSWHALETYKSLITYGHAVLRYVFIINGGAIIAILTFIGDMVSKADGEHVPDMRQPLIFFILGLLVSGIALCLAYWTQLTIYSQLVNKKDSPVHVYWFNGLVVCVGLGIIFFGIGSFVAISRLTAY
ncbi:MAG: hypothetical protein H0W44_09930 [Gammaproteobacteria bacterium]|nr:hypothetical protein [Gammaproteobacteria bacterium]